MPVEVRTGCNQTTPKSTLSDFDCFFFSTLSNVRLPVFVRAHALGMQGGLLCGKVALGCVVMACTGTACTGTACEATACTVTAHIAIAYVKTGKEVVLASVRHAVFATSHGPIFCFFSLLTLIGVRDKTGRDKSLARWAPLRVLL